MSFSTKLTDYFANGKCILAIGSEDIAPIEYLREEDAALVASTQQQIGRWLQSIVDNPELIAQFARKAYECGLKNHSEKMVQDTFKETLTQAAKSYVHNGIG